MKDLVVKVLFIGLVLWMAPAGSFALSKTDQLLLKKNFYFLYLLEQKNVKLSAAPFDAIRERLRKDALEALQTCTITSCFRDKLQFTVSEIESIGNELVRLTAGDQQVQFLIGEIRAAHAYQLFAAEADTGFIRKVWQADARGVNNILDVYLAGKAPLYPKIDSISFKKDDPLFRTRVGSRINGLLKDKNNTFYSIPLLLALEALRLNERDEAARYEPIIAGENAAAFRKVKKINWQQYPNSVILVPGLGPEQPDVQLDPNGAKRCDSAAVQYHAGKAPFIVVSGGHVHPYKTPYCEAVEMKKYMVKVLHIPASAVIIEPHARHTTTNLRNTNRIIYRFNIPAGKPVLIVTDAAQNTYINGNMRDRVVKELGYAPFQSIKKLSATETEYIPSDNSQHINSLDPLDP